jgi:hypothetical protein
MCAFSMILKSELHAVMCTMESPFFLMLFELYRVGHEKVARVHSIV